MVHRAKIYTLIGTLLFSAGIVLGITLGVSLLRQQVYATIAQRADYLALNSTPILPFPTPIMTPVGTATLRPSATAKPTATSTRLPTAVLLSAATLLSMAAPTATPLPTDIPTATPAPTPQRATRIEIPAIGLNTTIIESRLLQTTKTTGEVEWQWESVEDAVGHHFFSGVPGAGSNIVLSGHNNWRGEVFRYLPALETGNIIILYTADHEYRYRVVEKTIVAYRAAPAAGEVILQNYAQAGDTEKVTLVSCYPYLTNSDRIVVVAVPDREWRSGAWRSGE